MWRNRNSYLQVGSTVWTPHTAVSLSIVYKVEAEPAWLWDSFHEEWIRKETGSGLIKCCSWSCRNSKRLCHDSILVQDSWMTEPWMTLYFTKTRELALSLMRPPHRCTRSTHIWLSIITKRKTDGHFYWLAVTWHGFGENLRPLVQSTVLVVAGRPLLKRPPALTDVFCSGSRVAHV